MANFSIAENGSAGDKRNEMRVTPLMSRKDVSVNRMGELGRWLGNFINIQLVKFWIKRSKC